MSEPTDQLHRRERLVQLANCLSVDDLFFEENATLSKRDRKDMLAGLDRIDQFYQIESNLAEVGVESDFLQSDAFEALHHNSEGEFYPVQIQPLSTSYVADCAIHCHFSVESNVEWAEQKIDQGVRLMFLAALAGGVQGSDDRLHYDHCVGLCRRLGQAGKGFVFSCRSPT